MATTRSNYREGSQQRGVSLYNANQRLAFGGFALQTLGYQLTSSAGTAALMMPLEIPLATLLQAAIFGSQTIDAGSLTGIGLKPYAGEIMAPFDANFHIF